MSQTHVVPPAQIRPVLEAAAPQLEAAYNEQARAVRAVNATVRLNPVAGSAYTGVIQEYHDVGGFILAARPAMIRVIGQAPVVARDIFDMVSDGQTFSIYVPSKNQFLTGSTALERATKNPIENLRPQHILEALFWPELPAGAPVLFEQFDEPPARYYILTLLRQSESGLEIDRKIWFDRADLRVSRVQIYGPAGRLDSDIAYSDWQASSSDATPAGAAASVPAAPLFPREIRITRPQQDYQLAISVTKVTLNAEISADRFVLPQPAGTQLVRVGEGEQETQP
jgi:outer membrane lipoprotein-sorting protein